MTRIFLLISIVFSVCVAHAAPIPSTWEAVYLAKMTNDNDPGTNFINIVLSEDGSVKGLLIESDWNTFLSSTCDPVSAEGDFYAAEDLLGKKGVVVARCRGKRVLILKAAESDLGYTITMKYLSNGIWGKYKKCNMTLTYVPEWHLVNVHTGEKIEHMHLDTKWNGIKTIRGVCK